jgi:hypothetical protein
MKQTRDMIAAVDTNVKEDCHVSVRDFATVHGVQYGTINNILHGGLR